jgi:hypothetical protein
MVDQMLYTGVAGEDTSSQPRRQYTVALEAQLGLETVEGRFEVN